MKKLVVKKMWGEGVWFDLKGYVKEAAGSHKKDMVSLGAHVGEAETGHPECKAQHWCLRGNKRDDSC